MPWEGCGDLYREQFARGGIYAGDLFDDLIQKYMLRGNHGIESFSKMFKQHPLATSDENDWWNDERPDMKKIKISTYITSTWTNSMYSMGVIRGWLEVACNQSGFAGIHIRSGTISGVIRRPKRSSSCSWIVTSRVSTTIGYRPPESVWRCCALASLTLSQARLLRTFLFPELTIKSSTCCLNVRCRLPRA